MTAGFPAAREPSGPGALSRMRASDADRDRVVDVLRVAVGDGRLPVAELDERLEAALSARTLGELAALTADLAGRMRYGRIEARRAWRARRPAAWATALPAPASS